MLDAMSKPTTRHQVWLTATEVYDNAIPPGRSDVVRYRFRAPEGAGGPIRLRARVNYRRFNQEYTNFILMRRNVKSTLPVAKMAEASLTLRPGGTAVKARSAPDATAAKRWNDYAIGLMEQAQYGQAAEAFRRAADLDPSAPNPLASAALAEMRTERFGPEREQFHKANELITRARSPSTPPGRARASTRRSSYGAA